MSTNAKVKKIQSQLPHKSGVYMFLNSKNVPIYIGKAKDLRKRTAYYFKEENLPKRLMRMVSEAVNLEHFVTETEQDAFLLEAQLIKEKKPLYNILYQNGRSLYYIDFSTHAFPKVHIINEWRKNAVGPFLSIEYIKNMLNELLKIFKIRTCTDYVFKIRKRPCLEYFASRCSAPCVGLITEDEYKENAAKMQDLLKGNISSIIKQWKAELKNAIKDENFELAARKRDQIFEIEKLKNKQAIYFENIKRVDVIIQSKNIFYVESIENGGIKDIVYRKYEKSINMLEFLLEFYTNEPEYPIIGSHNFTEFSAQEDKQLSTEKIKPKHHFLFKTYTIANSKLYQNILKAANERMKHLLMQEKSENNIAKFLQIENLESIETYDSAHYSGKHARCGMVYFDFKKNEFVKNNYRTWKVPDSRNDLEILQNALQRRKAAGNLPSMILLDGGITQLNAAKTVLYPYKNIFAFSKGEKRKGGKLFDYNGRVILSTQRNDGSHSVVWYDSASSENSKQAGVDSVILYGNEEKAEKNAAKSVKKQHEENQEHENALLFLEKLRTAAHEWINRTTSKTFTKKFIKSE